MAPLPYPPSSYYDEFIDPFLPAKRAFIIRIEHLARYFFAKKMLQKNNIRIAYDISCGDGYGTKIISSVLPYVIGFDNNKELLEKAKKVYTRQNISYVYLDVEKFSLKDISRQDKLPLPQAIICFETLEHLENGEKVLNEFSEILPPEGLLILSTPNAQFEPKKQGKSKNIFHKKIYYPEELHELVRKNGFEIIGIYGQPMTNFLLHKTKFLVAVLNMITESNLILLVFFAYCFAYPLKNARNSYSQIIIAKRK